MCREDAIGDCRKDLEPMLLGLAKQVGNPLEYPRKETGKPVGRPVFYSFYLLSMILPPGVSNFAHGIITVPTLDINLVVASYHRCKVNKLVRIIV